ncbi:MAG: hypothetical protein IJ261_00675 [Clostridia bacterium]|nr:hypothetical protein [Clostridia bacterium]
MTVLYVITKILTFPGTITKAFFEQIMCRIFRCPVEDNRYLRTDEMCGHVEHELIERPVASYMFCFIPGILNFTLAMYLCLFPLLNIGVLGNYSGFIDGFVSNSEFLSKIIKEEAMINTLNFLLPFFFAWLCVSLLSNLFPLYEDSIVMKEQYKKLPTIVRVILFPGYIIMRIGSWLEKYGLTFVLLIASTFAIAVIVP